MLAWVRDRCSDKESAHAPQQPGPPPGPSQTSVADEEQRARVAEAACKAELAKLRCELEAGRLRREDDERTEEIGRRRDEIEEAKKQARAERAAREATVQKWREEQAQARRERREARHRFWTSVGGLWRKRQTRMLGQAGTLRVLLVLGLPAALAVLIYSLNQGQEKWDVLGLAALTAVASFSVGALVGFIFGIPRTIGAAKRFGEAESAKEKEEREKREEKTEASTEGVTPERAAAIAAQYAPNTNLEEVSDWLTKILVGVGLVQIHQVSGAVEDLADGLASGLGAQGFPVAVTLLIAFTITGFASAYLYTRLRLPSAFELATTKITESISQSTTETVRAQTDALALVQKQLSPGDVDRPPLEKLTEALKGATPGLRSQAFYRGREQRRKNWRGRASAGEDKDYVEPTIGVFKALIDCDSEGHYHRPRGELGYALKDQAQSDFAAARGALDEAIALRPSVSASQFGLYEFNRAYCSIRLDPAASTPGGKAETELVQAVVADLKMALRSADARSILAAALSGKGTDRQIKDETDEKAEANSKIARWIDSNKDTPEVKALLEELGD